MSGPEEGVYTQTFRLYAAVKIDMATKKVLGIEVDTGDTWHDGPTFDASGAIVMDREQEGRVSDAIALADWPEVDKWVDTAGTT